MNVNPAFQNFTAGELSPRLYGRSDIAQYRNGARKLENWMVETQGAATYRGGFSYLAGIKDNLPAMIVSYQYLDEQTYILEFTEGNIRVYANRAVVTSGGSPVDITVPYKYVDLFQLKFAQSTRDLYITHPFYPPCKLRRNNDATWTFEHHHPTGFSPSFFPSSNISGITNANPAVVSYTGSDDYDDGDHVYLEDVGGMTELNEQSFEIANVNTGANTFELLGVDSTTYGTYTSGGTVANCNTFPSACAFYEQRLIYGGTNDNTETLWFSKSADFDDFTVGTGATDGIKYTIASGTTNKIKWLHGTEDFLAIGGFGDLLRATGGEGQSAISPNTISIKPTNTYGAADINPVGFSQIVVFLQNNNRTLLSIELDPLAGVYRPVDRNILADHITKGGVKQICTQKGRPNVVWCVRNDGVLLGLTVEKEQEVSGWHKHTTNGEILSIASAKTTNGYEDLYVCVKRTINGVDKYFIEYLNPQIEFPLREDYILTSNQDNDEAQFKRALYEAQKDYIHLDCAGTFDGSLRPSDAGASLTVSAVTGSSVTFTASASVFVAGDVGSEIRIKSEDGSKYGTATITSYTSGTVVTCDIDVDFSGLSFTSAEWYLTADTITGLSHLNGETVKVVVDGCLHPDRTVSSGQITLETQASVCHVGFGYDGYIETMNLNDGARTGTAQTKKTSVAKIGLKLLNTLGLSFGTDYYNLDNRLLRSALDLMDNPPPLFTGDEVVRFKDGSKSNDVGWSREKRIVIKQSSPLPATVQLISPYYVISDVD